MPSGMLFGTQTAGRRQPPNMRRLLLQRNFHLCIIDTPLKDEFGDDLAMCAAMKELCQVILVTARERVDEISQRVEAFGVFTLAHPVDKALFWHVLKLAHATYYKMAALYRENDKPQQKMEEIRLVARAKCILI